MFFTQAEKFGDAPFLWTKRDGSWQSQSWSEIAARVSALSRGLRANGVKPGDRVIILSENRPAWFISDLAIMSTGAITVPAYTTNTVEDHVHVLSDSGAKVAIISGKRMAKNFIPAAVQAGLDLVITMEPIDQKPAQSVEVRELDEVTAQGRTQPDDVLEIVSGLKRTDTCCLIYTSGTSGTPNGVMQSHGSILCNCKGAEDVLKHLPRYGQETEVFLSFLPLSHSYEHSAGQFVPIGFGAQIYYAESIDKLVANIEEVRPTIMVSVPRLYETIRGRILRGAEQAGGLKQKMLLKAIALGRKRYEDPKSLSFIDRILDAVLEKLVRKKVQNRFGGRLKTFVSGGAPLNFDVGVFFLSIGLRVLQGYGQTESGPVIAVNRCELNNLRTVGPPMTDVEVKIAEDGEILCRGELVMNGYWNNPEKSAETVVDGWLHTGDVGHLNDDGYLVITDRKKDIIVNSGGDNVSPQRVEGILCLEPEIGQCMVYGDQKPHLVAAIVPDEEFMATWRKESGALDDQPLAEDPAFRRAINDAIERTRARLSVIERVRKFIIIEEPFSVENAMMTPSLKIRRHIVKENYGDLLEALYKK
nr:AMP-dependent synthetase/ligase [Aestuariispira insulae]